MTCLVRGLNREKGLPCHTGFLGAGSESTGNIHLVEQSLVTGGVVSIVGGQISVHRLAEQLVKLINRVLELVLASVHDSLKLTSEISGCQVEHVVVKAVDATRTDGGVHGDIQSQRDGCVLVVESLQLVFENLELLRSGLARQDDVDLTLVGELRVEVHVGLVQLGELLQVSVLVQLLNSGKSGIGEVLQSVGAGLVLQKLILHGIVDLVREVLQLVTDIRDDFLFIGKVDKRHQNTGQIRGKTIGHLESGNLRGQLELIVIVHSLSQSEFLGLIQLVLSGGGGVGVGRHKHS